MANEWIKIRLDLPDDPAVFAIAHATGLDPDAVVGKLVRLWVWFDTHTADGHARGVTFAHLDRVLFCDGFAQAMANLEPEPWLEVQADPPAVIMPRFDRHNGSSAKRRAQATRRKQKQRENEAEPETTPAAVTQPGPPPSRPDRDTTATGTGTPPRPKARPEEEEEREEEEEKRSSDERTTTNGRNGEGRPGGPSIDWEAARLEARAIAQTVPPAPTPGPQRKADRSLILKAAALKVSGQLSENAIADSLAAVSALGPNIKNRVAYFHKCLANQAADEGQNLAQLLAALDLPPGILTDSKTNGQAPPPVRPNLQPA